MSVPAYEIRSNGCVLPIWDKQNIAAGEFQPIKNPPGSVTVYREPTVWLPVWLDTRFKAFRDANGDCLYDRQVEGLLNLGAISSCGTRFVPYDSAAIRIHYAPPATVYSYSQSWNKGVNGTHGQSRLFACWPPNKQPMTSCGLRRVDVYIPHVGKDGSPGSINVIRSTWHSIITVGWGWYSEQSNVDVHWSHPCHAGMKSPFQSREISTSTSKYLAERHKLGWSDDEIARWQGIGRSVPAKRGQIAGVAWCDRRTP